jgi:hypothetical protein
MASFSLKHKHKKFYGVDNPISLNRCKDLGEFLAGLIVFMLPIRRDVGMVLSDE